VDTGGAGDQGLMFGFACNETPELMPMTLMLAHKLVRRLSDARRQEQLPYLRPDGKSQVTIEYHGSKPVRVEAVVVSTQHDEKVTTEQLRADVEKHVIRNVIPAELLDRNTKFYINPTGRFVKGGPHADTGLTGRKIIVDTYGPSKVDRSASYMARYIAKNLVAAKLAERVEVQIAYAIGIPDPVSVMVDSFGTGKLPDEEMSAMVVKQFPLTPRAIIKHLDLLRPIYTKTAAFGHFGRTEPEFTWERTDRAEALRKEAGI
jgi:S-adenosylmethionine synthetase